MNRIETWNHQLFIPFLLHASGAFLVWIGASLVIRWAKFLLGRSLQARKVDATLVLYANQSLGLGLRALAIIAILNIFGIETTSFSAVVAATGVAIGVAWSGLLSNFAAGIFLIVFRPFKTGDSITCAGISGVVREIGIFATWIDNVEQQRIFVPNNKLFSENIVNSSANPWRMATFRVVLSHTAEIETVIPEISHALQSIPGVRPEPPASGEIVELTSSGVSLQFRAACTQSVHASVMNSGYAMIHAILKKDEVPVPEYRTGPLTP
jgi:small conductance mechanosensitive channel